MGLCAFTAEGQGSVPGQGTKIPQAKWHGQKKKKKKNFIMNMVKNYSKRYRASNAVDSQKHKQFVFCRP